MLITWRDQMSVGIKAIDDDHKHLIDIINQLEIAIRKTNWQRSEREDFMQVLLGRLRSYAKEHFSREEELQVASNYQGLIENQRHHHHLVTDLESYSSRFLGQRDGEKPVTDNEMVKFLRRWLVEHIIKVDLKMKGHVSAGG